MGGGGGGDIPEKFRGKKGRGTDRKAPRDDGEFPQRRGSRLHTPRPAVQPGGRRGWAASPCPPRPGEQQLGCWGRGRLGWPCRPTALAPLEPSSLAVCVQKDFGGGGAGGCEVLWFISWATNRQGKANKGRFFFASVINKGKCG